MLSVSHVVIIVPCEVHDRLTFLSTIALRCALLTPFTHTGCASRLFGNN